MADDTSNGDDTPPSFDPATSVGDRSTDALISALADQRTRRVVAALESESVDVVELNDLVDSVVKAERESDPDRDDAAVHRKRVAIDLHHRSLPKLDDAGVLDYDPRSNTIRYRDGCRVSAYLDLFDREEDS